MNLIPELGLLLAKIQVHDHSCGLKLALGVENYSLDVHSRYQKTNVLLLTTDVNLFLTLVIYNAIFHS